MSIEIIPSGASAVVTDHQRGDNRRYDVELMEAIKDAEAHVACTVKDAEADLERSSGQHYADTVKTVKDAEAQLDRAGGDRFMQTVQDIKDAETRMHEDFGNKIIDVIQDVKDAETRLHKDAADKFISTIEDVKDSDRRGSERAGRVIDTVRQTAFDAERSESTTREYMLKEFRHADEKLAHGFCGVKEVVRDKYEALAKEVGYGFKESQQIAYQNQLATLLQFKDAALLSEKLAAKQELLSEKLAAAAQKAADDCCCELKERIAADGQKTRDLINAQEVDRLRERAQKAETQLTLLSLNVGVGGVSPLKV